MENIINTIDLSTPTRELSGNSKQNPICIGLQGDIESFTIPFRFNTTTDIDGCKCFVQFINANKEEILQEINNKYSEQIGKDGIINLEGQTCLDIDWKPPYGLTKEKGLVSFSFSFRKISKQNKILEDETATIDQSEIKQDPIYTFILNTSPIYGYIHSGLVIDEEMISEKYPSQIAELYDKYNKLIKDDEDLEDLESLTDIKLYLDNRVPQNIEDTNNNDGYFLIAYNPETKRYSYTPAIKLNEKVIIGNIWNAE